jgi:steroid delta-isomerase-like uncharacterized protein
MAAEIERLIRQWFEEVWNKGRAEAIDEMIAPDCIIHGLSGAEGDARGPAAFKPFFARFKGAFPDIQIAVEEVIVDGDRCACRFTGRMTHQGDHLGVPATGRDVALEAMAITHWKNGQIVEAWNTVDMLGMLQQIGAVPSNVMPG